MNATPLSTSRTVWTALACTIFAIILCICGCGTPADTAGAVAAAAASNVIAAATQPTTQSAIAAASAVTTSASSKGAQGIWGRWVRNGNVINADGSFSSGQLCEWNFARNGSFQNQARFGVANETYMIGTFKVVGSVLTLSVGKAQQMYTYQIKGSELSLTNPQTHVTVVLQRG